MIRLLLALVLSAVASVASAATVERFLVEMSDGIRLATDVYLPSDGENSWPVLLYRTPYGIDGDNIGNWAQNHYAVVCQDIRGRFDSEGVFQFFREDGWGPDQQDGLETVSWIHEQPWYNGTIGTMGSSARGLTQFLLAGALPTGLECQYIEIAPTSLYHDAVFTGGAFRERLIVNWLTLQESKYLLDTLAVHPNYDEWWSWLDSGTRDSLITVPAYHRGGWYDIYTDGQVAKFASLQEGGGVGARGNQKLVMGPWAHLGGSGQLEYPGNAGLEYAEALVGSKQEWLRYWLQGEKNGVMDLPHVAYYVMGDVGDPCAPGNEWRTADTWPPPATEQSWYLHADGSLDPAPPEGAASVPSSYVFDPYDPVPTIGGANRFGRRGPYDQRPVESRSDVLVYTSELLEEAVEIAGPVRVVLYASSDRVDTDFTVKLTDVYPDGRSMLVCDNILRARHRISMSSEDFLVPGTVYAFDILVGETALAFAPGHRIRLAVSSSNYDRFDVNPNTGEPFAFTYDQMLVANNTIYHADGARSRLILRCLVDRRECGIPGDIDGDGDVDLFDFESLQLCFTGPGGGPVDPDCQCADFDQDDDVDMSDFGALQAAFTGP